jgi:hypothetical protein
MGNNLNFTKSCCRNLCRDGNRDEFKDEYITKYKNSIKEVLIIQRVFRKFILRKQSCSYNLPYIKYPKGRNIIKHDSNNIIHLQPNSTDFDFSIIPGILIEQSSSLSQNFSSTYIQNEIVQGIESKLGNFSLNDKESLVNSYTKLKKYCIRYSDSSIYKGYFNKLWQKEGYGVLYLPDGSKYEGFFTNNVMSGRGRLISSNGYYYEGNFALNCANGLGKFVNNDGAIYVGYWKNDRQHGLGEEVYQDGSRYEGNFEFGKKSGKGLFIFPDNSQYNGSFENNMFHGFGIYRWSDGRIYQGEWGNNKMHGKGIFIWPDKKKYIGGYEDDKKDGFGIFIWPDGKTYEGMWKDGKQHGYGRILITSPEYKTLGEWADGKKIKTINQGSYDEVNDFINNQKVNAKLHELTGGLNIDITCNV